MTMTAILTLTAALNLALAIAPGRYWAICAIASIASAIAAGVSLASRLADRP